VKTITVQLDFSIEFALAVTTDDSQMQIHCAVESIDEFGEDLRRYIERQPLVEACRAERKQSDGRCQIKRL